MKLKINWITITIGIGLVVLVGVLIVATSPLIRSRLGALKDKLPQSVDSEIDKVEKENTEAGVTVDVEEKATADEKPDSVLGNEPEIKSPATPIIPPTNQVPWGQGPSQ